MTPDDYTKLYEKLIAGTCTKQEKEMLLAYEQVHDTERPTWDTATMGDKDVLEQALLERLEQRMKLLKAQPIERRLAPMLWKAAAAVSIVALSSYFILTQSIVADDVSATETVVHTLPSTVHDVAPGGNKAVLTLDNGKQVVLNDAGKGLVAQQGNTRLTKQGDGMLAYTAGANEDDEPIGYNTVTTPRGGQYQVTLPDGTGVWLNASSSIRFPTRFVGTERRVAVTGEVYLEVHKDASMPFHVMARGQDVTVLGTIFNVMAYPDELCMKTTLMEGSVRVSSPHGNVLLKPGEQCVYNSDRQTVRVVEADVDEALAWKTGQFIFNDEDLRSIMRKVSRWYDVDVQYADNMKAMSFTGAVSRFENVSGVLKMLELTGTVHFKIEERRVNVMP